MMSVSSMPIRITAGEPGEGQRRFADGFEIEPHHTGDPPTVRKVGRAGFKTFPQQLSVGKAFA